MASMSSKLEPRGDGSCEGVEGVVFPSLLTLIVSSVS